MNTQNQGLLYEIKALFVLRKLKLRLVHFRYRGKCGEIDIIAKDKDTFVFVEVKAGTKGRFDARSRVTEDKRNRMKRTAIQYMKKFPDSAYRFDILEIGQNGYEHIVDAF